MSFDTDDRNAKGDVSNKTPLTRDKLQPTAQELWWSRRLLTPLGRALSLLDKGECSGGRKSSLTLGDK